MKKAYRCRDCEFATDSKARATLHTLSKNWFKALWPVYGNNHEMQQQQLADDHA